MFTKLFSSITTSSIWNEDNNTRIVWITMLAMANKNGYVSASVGGLAHEARVDRESCEKALAVLTSPDTDSRSKEFEGRRVEIVDGGFQLLNHAKYREIRSEEDRKEYMKVYMRLYRAKVNNNISNVSECKHLLAKAEADTDTDTEKKAPLTQKLSEEEFLNKLRGSPAYQGINVDEELAKMDVWLLTKPGRRKTRKFVVAWLNRTEPTISKQTGAKLSPVEQNAIVADRRRREREEIEARAAQREAQSTQEVQ